MENITTRLRSISGSLPSRNLFNAFGSCDYFMTRTKGAEWIKSLMPMRWRGLHAYIDAFPIWSHRLGACVWAGLAGSICIDAHRWQSDLLVSFVGPSLA